MNTLAWKCGVVIIVVSVSVLATACGGTISHLHGHGPLAWTESNGNQSYGEPVVQGQPISYGLLIVKNHGSRPVILDKADLINHDDGVKAIGAYVVVVPQPNGLIGVTAGEFRRPSYGQSLTGVKVEPNETVQVVLGLATTKPGRHDFRAVALHYHDANGTYKNDYPLSGRFCSPVKRYFTSCKAPK
jgi:hypothetical protein